MDPNYSDGVDPEASNPPSYFAFDNDRINFLSGTNGALTWPLPLDQHHHHDYDLQTSSAPVSAPRSNSVLTGAMTVRSNMMPTSLSPLDTTTSSANATSAMTAEATAVTSSPPLDQGNITYSNVMDPAGPMLTSDWSSGYHVHDHHSGNPFTNAEVQAAFSSAYSSALQTSPVDYISSSQAQMQPTYTMAQANAFINYQTTMAPMNPPLFPQMSDFSQELNSIPYGLSNNNSNELIHPPSIANSSPAENWIDESSLSGRSDNGWQLVSAPPSRASFDSFDYTNDVGVSPQALHLSPGRPRTESSSSDESHVPMSARSMSSFEEITWPMNSPESETLLDYPQQMTAHGLTLPDHTGHYHGNMHSAMVSPQPGMVSPPQGMVSPLAIQPASSPTSTGSISSGAASPSSSRRPTKTAPAPTGVTPKAINKKKATAASKAEKANDKKVGKRKGPLRPEQRQQAHEIRKLRACLRCKFLKKTCDTGDPCAGCQPSHARLWQVPCTRQDIKDMNFFLRDWNKDYERHITLGFSIANIKGFSNVERIIHVTHGYGRELPITAREVYVRDDSVFTVDWVEAVGGEKKHHQHELTTNRLSAGMEGISRSAVSDYLDQYLDFGFEDWVDTYLDGTPFLTELIKTAYHYYLRSKLPVIRKALKMIVAYCLTCHITMVRGLTEEEAQVGRIEEVTSSWQGETVAPVMVNFQVKKAMADMWRELMKDVLEELSSLFSSVYSGEKLKNWPTIFLLASLILAVWEMIQFDMHYRENDNAAISKFDEKMEEIPVGVVVGLFCAISHQLPSFMDWDTQKHHHVLNSNPAVCEAMTEVRGHVTKHEAYLRSRNEAKFDREDFDCLSNKFLSKLVIRAN